MPQFTLKRLYLSITLIAAGVGMFMLMMSRKVNPNWSDFWREPPKFDLLGDTLWFLAGAAVVAAICLFAKRPLRGAVIGAFVGAFLMLILMSRA